MTAPESSPSAASAVGEQASREDRPGSADAAEGGEKKDAEQNPPEAKPRSLDDPDVLAGAAVGGRAADTNQKVREAQRVFRHGGAQLHGDTTVQGDLVAGDSYNYKFFYGSAASSGTTYRVHRELLELARDAYAPSEAHDGLIDAYATFHVFIIRAPRGHGRTAAALHLLAQSFDNDLISVLHPEATIPVIEGAVGGGSACLLEDMPQRTARELTARAMDDLDAKLRSASSRVILAVSDAVVFPDQGVHRYVRDLGLPASHRAILDRHLTWRLDASGREITGRDDLMDLFATTVASSSSRERAAEFARHAAELAQKSALTVESLQAAMERLIDVEVESWFATLTDDATRCLAVSLALLDGLPHEIVAKAAEDLQEQLDPKPKERPERFHHTRSSRLTIIRAKIVAEQVPSRLGDLPAEVVHFQDAAYPSALLNLVWREYDDAREPLLAWLSKLASHEDSAVRIRAAIAIGWLSLGSFQHILNSVIRTWARDSDERRREAVAYALRRPGTQENLQRQVGRLLDEWVSDSAWQLQATAARVFGAALGSVLHERSIDALDRLAETEVADVGLAIGNSLAELVDSEPGQAATVLEMVLHWISDGSGPRNAAGEAAFLILAGDLIEANSANSKAEGMPCPLLLRLSAYDRNLRGLVAVAWQQVLSGRRFHENARQIAGRWAERTEADAEARRAMAVMFATTASGSYRAAKIVKSLAVQWGTQTNNPYSPRTAAEILAALA